MKTLIFSDTHLSHKFDRRLYKALENLIESSDRVIINGDFWDHYLTSWNKFLNSKWKMLFPLLKSKNTTYIYGNHDKKEWMDERVNQFSTSQANEIKVDLKDKNFIIQHGHLISPSIEERHPVVLRKKQLAVLSYILYKVLFSLFGSKFLVSGKEQNKQMKDYVRMNFNNNEVLVTGHSHFFENDQENRFINIGLIRDGYLQYMIIDNEDIILINQRY